MSRLVAILAAAVIAGCVGAPTEASERVVRERWQAYLASKDGRFWASASTPSALWSAEEQAQWPGYDLALPYVPNGAFPEIASVTPVDATRDSAYRIVTRFWADSAAVGDSTAVPVMTTTVYARREGRRWMLANALPYHTGTWARETRGRIRYRIAPTLRFDAAKAERAAAFVDSVATAFEVEPPAYIDYYVAESVDQALEILGVQAPERYGPNGGFSKPINRQVFSGIPALGENYRHELVHVLLLPVLRGTTTSLLASEGVPTWLGGRGELGYEASVRALDSTLRARPALNLHAIVYDLNLPADIRNVAGAVLADMVHEAGGVPALRRYLTIGEYAMPDTLERVFGQPWEQIGAAWRQRVRDIAARR